MRISSSTGHLTLAEFTSGDDFTSRWNAVDVLAVPAASNDRYIAGFASSDRAIELALRLRYQVFNVELDEGLASSVETGLDRDRFDVQMRHLVLLDSQTHDVVGTYRIQTVEQAQRGEGIYSAQEFDLAPLQSLFPETIELGRACVAIEHRNFRAMIAMWLGIGAFMNAYKQRYLFGCCSLTTQDPDDGWRALKTLRKNECLHGDYFVPATAEYSCGLPEREQAPDLGDPIRLPKLFRTYLRLGAKVVSEPAIDRDFGTVDFLVLLDGREVALSRLDVLV